MKCTICSHKMVDIVYGYPTPDLIEKAQKDKIALGGLRKSLEDPTHYCYSCHETYPISQTSINFDD